jgi:hypothetical protein
LRCLSEHINKQENSDFYVELMGRFLLQKRDAVLSVSLRVNTDMLYIYNAKLLYVTKNPPWITELRHLSGLAIGMHPIIINKKKTKKTNDGGKSVPFSNW